ncbi:bifunctional UDP-N-acetylmuramoyl-L-alanyl-D-glutamate--2,6-diaminopimelate ligase MurE/UDP-N-acetylmuramoyl-tripeptide--D-alanyl-D-alanine ligase MurF [Orrella marina]|uniref:Multifunctional fusion protein n=1 Tax=Orrella marina TaxID=2163011 RepID=A0A2R4XKN3_9BURK|nr:bifunctional UDP-N-acetylmuramoyl-L-alanyl-D-glutamate--2,6-diaminopimelate ligase MurE/UDP-N-acetylmuramoyl-tripeptide--D-alanyl-D-alanine ligase MurF [Orrella marina]AWB34279.1 UDP-N-acetylmuramoyl-L-alanyl-D-glutamate--2,6-diaminopimelate ligase [Orrella marina]
MTLSPSVVRNVSDLIERVRLFTPAHASLSMDSRMLGQGDVFVACPGQSSDGRNYIADAVSHGAAAVIAESGLTPAQLEALGQIPVVEVPGLTSMLGELAHHWWGQPSADVQVIAVTGTNGKTTTSQLIGAALRGAGQPCAVLGTLGLFDGRGEQVEDATLTTPDVVSVHKLIAKVRQAGARYLVLEASSIGLDQGRLDGVLIHTAIFTNLTQDHLDYHSDMQTYGQAKARLFARPGLVKAVINADDAASQIMVQESAAEITTFGFHAQAIWRASSVCERGGGIEFDLCHAADQTARIVSCFTGQYNVSNLLAVAATLDGLGWSFKEIASSLGSLPPVSGRMEPVTWSGQAANVPLVLVDYAHTPDALENALQSLRGVAQARQGKVWCVAGCGGDRDRSKRKPMGAVLCRNADRFIVTSDNPRNEAPESILAEIWSGVSDAVDVSGTSHGSVEIDREVAILSAIWQADPQDVVLIAGKGHETYQITGDCRRDFDDRQWARLALLFYARDAVAPIPAIVIDSRQVSPGSLFVAIAGERFDGHQFLADVTVAGACAALVSRVMPEQLIPQIVVDDTRSALQAMARAWREQFHLPVVGVTGSNGKTTTKEMIATVLGAWVGQASVLATQGNLNNDLGVPLTLLRLRSWHKAAVVELGMNHPGEIAQLSRLAQPTVGLVLNAQREHQEFMGSVEAVAQENGQVLARLPASGVAVYMDQPPYTRVWAGLGAHVSSHWTFGSDITCTFHASGVQLKPDGSEFCLCSPAGEREVSLRVPGWHNVINALASAACALAAGASLDHVVTGLESFQAVKGRMQVHRLPGARVLIDDTYNANPDSVRAAIDVLRSLDAPRVLVLGDMGEVGDEGPLMHEEIGHYARTHQVDHLLALGAASRLAAQAFGVRGCWFEGIDELVTHLRELNVQSVLVKGSRFMALERVVKAVLAQENFTNNNKTGEHGHAG